MDANLLFSLNLQTEFHRVPPTARTADGQSNSMGSSPRERPGLSLGGPADRGRRQQPGRWNQWRESMLESQLVAGMHDRYNGTMAYSNPGRNNPRVLGNLHESNKSQSCESTSKNKTWQGQEINDKHRSKCNQEGMITFPYSKGP